jgi:hypothetical protein
MTAFHFDIQTNAHLAACIFHIECHFGSVEHADKIVDHEENVP